MGASWTWSYDSRIYFYLYNQSLSLLKFGFRIPFMTRCTWCNICNKVCQWLVTGRYFSPDTPVPSTNKTDDHDKTENLLKVVLSTLTLGTLNRVGYLVWVLWLTCFRRLLHLLSSQSFDYERIWWKLFQKRVVCIKLDINVFIISLFSA